MVKLLEKQAVIDPDSLFSLSKSLIEIGKGSYKSLVTMAVIWKQVSTFLFPIWL